MDQSSAENELTAKEIESLDVKELLEWIQKKVPSLREADSNDQFLKSQINGHIFLKGAGDIDFFMEADLAFGPSAELAELAQSVISKKRDREQAGLAEPSDTTFKKWRLDSEINPKLLNVAKRARERRELVVEKIATIDRIAAARLSNAAVQPSGAAVELSGVVAELSNPAFDTKLPFPFVGAPVPKRFKVEDGDGNDWFYVGRERFTELLDLFRIVQRKRDHSALWVYGTKGYGKSHLLAALVCYLVARKERVVYLPDCRGCIDDPVGYVQAAMLFAWADDPNIQNEIIALDTQEMIHRFFERHEKSIFVIDQMNAFEDDGEDEYGDLKEIHRWLKLCMAGHPAVLGTSANYQGYLRQRITDSTEDTMHVYSGFATREMEQWWERNSRVALGDYTKAQVEDITGCIPLLLDICVVDGKIDLDVTAFRNIYHQAAAFEQKIIPETRDKPLEWEMHCEYVMACFSRGMIPRGSPCFPKLIDHRYFYHEYKRSEQDRAGDYGNYACGLTRNAVAAELLASKVNFADTGFLRSLSNFINNPSVAGFMIEHAVLSSIGSNGLAIGEGIQTPMDIITFKTAIPDFKTNITDRPVLFRPAKFNFKGIDGVIVRIETRPKSKGKGKGTRKRDAEEEKRKLFMYPFQITLTPDSHSDSHETFFNQYDKWIKGLEEFNIVPEFLWITPNPSSRKKHGEKSRPKWPAHHERYVSLKDVNEDIWRRYQLALQDKEMSGDTGIEGQGATEQGVQKHTGVEEQGDTGEQGDTEEQGGAEKQEMAEGRIMKRLRTRKVMPRDEVSKEGDSQRRMRGKRTQRGRGTRSK